MAEQLKPNERELMAAIAALRDVSPDEQEAACLALQEQHGVEAVARARALLSVEKRTAKVTAELDAVADAETEKQPAMELVEFHKSDFAPEVKRPPTIEEKQEMLENLADLWSVDPLQYAEKKKQAADWLGISQEVVERAVKRIADGRPRKDEQSQATRLMAIGFGEGVELWHSENGMGHASVWVDGHLEHYRIKSTAFEGWLRGEYGRINQVKVSDR